jgi:hypothetical protein
MSAAQEILHIGSGIKGKSAVRNRFAIQRNKIRAFECQTKLYVTPHFVNND